MPKVGEDGSYAVDVGNSAEGVGKRVDVLAVPCVA
jgi:hypothetical protein